MGSRAHYVIVTTDGWSLYYSHWGATTILRDLFWSPEVGIAFIRSQAACATDAWMDNVWCEAGALLNGDEHLIVFGGNGEIPERRLWLSLMRYTWPGWTIRWAAEGLGEIVDYVGVDRAVVRGDRRPDPVTEGWDAVHDGEAAAVVVSVRADDGDLRVHLSDCLVDDLMVRGRDLLELASNPRPDARLRSLPSGGARVDLDSMTLLWWTGADVMDLLDVVADKWRDFTETFVEDHYEGAARTGWKRDASGDPECGGDAGQPDRTVA